MLPSSDQNGAVGADDEGYEISIVGLANVLLRNLWLTLIIPAVFVAVALAGVLKTERQYVARASFVPQSADGMTLTPAAGLARQFGVDIGRERLGQSPQFYVDLLNGHTILTMAVESEYDVTTEAGDSARTTLVQLFRAEGGGRNETPLQLAVDELRSRLNTSVARETGIVTVTVRADDPRLAEQISSRLLQLMNDFNLEARRQRAQEESRFVAARLEEAQRELAQAEREQERFLSTNRVFRNSPELLLEYERLQRQVIMRQELYSSLLRTYDQVRIDAVRDTPLLTVIDRPVARAQPRRGVRRLILAGVFGVMVAVLVAFLREAARHGRRTDNADYRELRHLTRAVWQDVRHPLRRFRGRARMLPSDRE